MAQSQIRQSKVLEHDDVILTNRLDISSGEVNFELYTVPTQLHQMMLTHSKEASRILIVPVQVPLCTVNAFDESMPFPSDKYANIDSWSTFLSQPTIFSIDNNILSKADTLNKTVQKGLDYAKRTTKLELAQQR